MQVHLFLLFERFTPEALHVNFVYFSYACMKVGTLRQPATSYVGSNHAKVTWNQVVQRTNEYRDNVEPYRLLY